MIFAVQTCQSYFVVQITGLVVLGQDSAMVLVNFDSSGSGVQGYFFPSGKKSLLATVIFLQGFPGVHGDEFFCERLADAGFNVLTFNYRGTFNSEGFFSFLNVIDDIGAALHFVETSPTLGAYLTQANPIVLGGWSFGGAIVPVGARKFPQFQKFFSISGRNFGREARKIEQDGAYAQQVGINLAAIRVPNGPVTCKDNLLAELVESQSAFDLDNLASYLIDRSILLIGA